MARGVRLEVGVDRSSGGDRGRGRDTCCGEDKGTHMGRETRE